MSQLSIWLQQYGAEPAVVTFWRAQAQRDLEKKMTREPTTREAALRNCMVGIHSYSAAALNGDGWCEHCGKRNPSHSRSV